MEMGVAVGKMVKRYWEMLVWSARKKKSER